MRQRPCPKLLTVPLPARRAGRKGGCPNCVLVERSPGRAGHGAGEVLASLVISQGRQTHSRRFNHSYLLPEEFSAAQRLPLRDRTDALLHSTRGEAWHIHTKRVRKRGKRDRISLVVQVRKSYEQISASGPRVTATCNTDNAPSRRRPRGRHWCTVDTSLVDK